MQAIHVTGYLKLRKMTLLMILTKQTVNFYISCLLPPNRAASIQIPTMCLLSSNAQAVKVFSALIL
jgi:hypothetical protein